MVANKVSDAMEDRVCRLSKIEVSPVLDERVEQLQKKARERERADSAQGHMASGSTWINMLLPKVGLVWYSE